MRWYPSFCRCLTDRPVLYLRRLHQGVLPEEHDTAAAAGDHYQVAPEEALDFPLPPRHTVFSNVCVRPDNLQAFSLSSIDLTCATPQLDVCTSCW